MDTKLFHSMFGPLTDKQLSSEELRQAQKNYPKTFGGYPSGMIAENMNNSRLAQDPNHLGYEDLFGAAARVFSPENPQEFMQYFQENGNRMSPWGLKKLFDYVQWLNQANELNRGRR